MISGEKSEEIRRLHASGTAIRAIARELHIDRGTVHRVIRDQLWTARHTTTKQLHQIRQMIRYGVHSDDICHTVGVQPSLVRRFQTERDAHYADTRIRGVCPTCGMRVPLPCVACAASDANVVNALFTTERPFPNVVLGVDLLPDDYARYLEIRHKKITTDSTN